MRTYRAGAVLLGLLVLIAVAAPLIAPYDPDERTGRPFARPSGEHLLGTNDVGHDLLSELIFGARVSLTVGITAALVATLIGVSIGLIAGYSRGWLDAVLMRIVDVVLSLPLIPLALVIGVVAGPGLKTQIAVIASVIWAEVARELRAQVLSLRERDHIRALQAMGARPRYVMPRHILPATLPVAVPQFILAAKTAIVLEASLAFLGLGDLTTKSWGTMLSVAYSRSAFLTDAWLWWVVPPGLAIAATVLAFALVGYGVEERARPALRDRRPSHRPPAPVPVPTAAVPTIDAVPLRIEGLRIGYAVAGTEDPAVAVHSFDLAVAAGETVAIVGESGSGKSSVAAVTVGLLPPAGRVLGGRILVAGAERETVDMVSASPARLRAVRGSRIGFVPQEAMSALNPVHTIEAQLVEAIRAHPVDGRGRTPCVRRSVGYRTLFFGRNGMMRRPGRAEARRRASELLELVGLDPARGGDYPHQLSGGMRQRVVIAIALAGRPAVLVADEPTSGLDVLVQAEIIDLLERLRRRLDLALVLISHDLPAVEAIADRIAVMRAGHLVELAPTGQLRTAPAHPYTRMLLGSLDAPVLARPAPGPGAPLLRIENLDVTFGHGPDQVTAVRGLDLDVGPGESVGLVGGSGAGKSTVARAIMGLASPDGGRIVLNGVDLAALPRRAGRTARRGVHLVFQDPYAALPPTLRVDVIVTEPMLIHGIGDRAERRERVRNALAAVRLEPDLFGPRYAHQLSGGERQRVALARALVTDPALIVADEPTGMLDATLRSGIADLLEELRVSRGLAVLHITHDLALARRSCDRVVVMRAGRVVETGRTGAVFASPTHPYTAALVARAGTRVPVAPVDHPADPPTAAAVGSGGRSGSAGPG